MSGREAKRSLPGPEATAAHDAALARGDAGYRDPATGLFVMTERYPTKEALDAEGTGAAEATHETFAQLDELLAERTG